MQFYMIKDKIIFFDAPQFKTDRDLVTIEHQIESDSFYMVGFSGLYANTIKGFLPGYEIEVWRIDDRVDQLKTRNVNGIQGKIYPVKIFLSRDFAYNFSLIKDLKKEAKANNLVFIFSGMHSFFFLILSVFFRTTPIVGIQLGGANSYFKYKINKSIISLIYSEIESKIYLKKLTHARLYTNAERIYLGRVLENKQISDFPVLPIDFDLMHPIDKKIAREYLKLPENEKIIYQTGRAFRNKGTDVTISVWLKYLKDKGIKLILTGIHESDELFDLVKNSGVNYIGVVPRADLPYWYSAADIYIYPPFDNETLNFGGVGYAPLEALACGTPLVCTTMINFSDFIKNENRIKEICVIPTNEEDVANGVLFFLHSPPSKEKCRTLITDYFTKEKIGENFANTILNIQKMHT
jgi:glycosyltransferase involved in cell wall biosynthesis